MKKTIAILFIAVAVVALAGCGTALHNAGGPTSVTLKVVNWPDGEYSFVGAFATDSWANTKRVFTVTAGEGEMAEASVISGSPFAFSIVDTGTWVRSWFPAITGNTPDYNNGNQNFTHEFTLDGLVHVILIDGSNSKVYIDDVESEYMP